MFMRMLSSVIIEFWIHECPATILIKNRARHEHLWCSKKRSNADNPATFESARQYHPSLRLQRF